ncbi:MAG: AMP-binding protein, partial [Marmoricola sp.]
GHWELNLPPTYVAGVQVLYRTIVAGPDATRRYVSLVPTQLVRALREDFGLRDRLIDYDAVLIGGGPLNAAVRREAEGHAIKIVQTYGMSETCGGCVYDGLPLEGVELKIEDGQVLLRGPMLFDGYDGEPERTAAAFDGGWFHTDDLGSIDDGGRLHIEGRADDMIISGGVKVPARAVATALTAEDAVVGVEVVGVPDDEWGERVVAVVAARDPLSLASLRDLVEPRSWAPRQLVVVEEIPTLSNGKPDRMAMKQLAIAEWPRG